MMRRTWIAVAVLGLAGCVGSTPPRLYTLNLKPSGGVPQLNVNLEVERLRPLDALSRGDIVIRLGDNEIDFYTLDHWASNLGELTTQKLAAEFGPEDAARPTLLINGDILSFEQVRSADGTAEGHVALALEVRKKNASRYVAPLVAKTYEARVPIDEVTPARTVTALTQAVESIARDLAVDANALNLTQEPADAVGEHLHTLDMTPSGKTKAMLNIDVTSLRRNEALARNSILMRTGPTTIEYYGGDRWAASVSTIVAEKLEAEFGAPVTGRDTVQLSGAILAFERLDGANGPAGHVKLDVTLQGKGGPGAEHPMLWKVYEASVSAASDSAADVAAALSQSVCELAAEIAGDAARIPPVQAAPTEAPVRLYTLDMTPSGKVKCPYNVVIDRIQPHDSLTRADILIVRDKTNVDRFEHDRWASSLSELVTEKLAAEFGPATDGRKTVSISGSLTGFERVEDTDGASALAKVSLTIRWADGAFDVPAARRDYEAKVSVDGKDAAAAVRALSRAVEEIAVKMAEDISALKEPAQ